MSVVMLLLALMSCAAVAITAYNVKRHFCMLRDSLQKERREAESLRSERYVLVQTNDRLSAQVREKTTRLAAALGAISEANRNRTLAEAGREEAEMETLLLRSILSELHSQFRDELSSLPELSIRTKKALGIEAQEVRE